MKRTNLLALATLGSAGLMVAALGFQHLGGMAPCKLCIWQRYPHVIAIVIGVMAITLKARGLILVGAAAAATTSAIGFYHVGVEQGWWEGPSTCSSGSIDNLSADDLMEQILSAPLVRCDEIPWELFGISMAGWNGVVSFALMVVWLLAWRRA